MRNYLYLSFVGVSFFIFTACSSAKLREEYFIPEKGGIVSYSNSSWLREKNKIEALEIGQKFCRGPVKTLSENTDQNDSSVVLLKFRCALQGKRKEN